ncbi:MAG: recombination mediator RecR [Gammaproteobacteria bacterium]|nr:recombination mediator RecR [Gammaproteobacteria bacterium]MCY4211616.1 recombination mediator RecR [Gammaproteobacteria bacterium]MCY4282415.1 recombination mediator RecR [Gammaproteobacteria bacterium]MCY4338802.1 recombination mediator RecR [Gammaproteobacteria bacterium]
MQAEPARLSALIQALCRLPGIGRKSAQRISYHLLQRDRSGGNALALALTEAMTHIGACERCRNFSETPVCSLCLSEQRDSSLLCIVESPADVFAMEEAGYQGKYFVLMGRLSPLDGIGPQELGLDKLAARLAGARDGAAGSTEVKEVILATNSTMEGEATAHYINDIVRNYQIRVTRIAHGVPLGGELEYIDSHTLSHALAGRREVAA